MSVTVNDFRKHAAAAAEKAAKENTPVHIPIAQVESADATTGDEKFDKLIRAIQLIIDALEPQILDIQKKAMGAPTHDMVGMCQREYWYQKGKQDCLKEVIKLPAQIVLESRMITKTEVTEAEKA